MNLASTDIKLGAARAMKDIFDTFKRSTPLRFYKLANEHVNVFDPLYNGEIEDFNENSNITQTAQYSDFYVRIWYASNQEGKNFISGNDDLGVRIKLDYNVLKIQMEADAFEFLKDTVRFTIFNEEYEILSPWRRLGILGEFQFYEIVLKRSV